MKNILAIAIVLISTICSGQEKTPLMCAMDTMNLYELHTFITGSVIDSMTQQEALYSKHAEQRAEDDIFSPDSIYIFTSDHQKGEEDYKGYNKKTLKGDSIRTITLKKIIDYPETKDNFLSTGYRIEVENLVGRKFNFIGEYLSIEHRNNEEYLSLILNAASDIDGDMEIHKDYIRLVHKSQRGTKVDMIYFLTDKI